MTQQTNIPQPPRGPICQSCSMPLARAEDFGSESDGSPSEDYCRYCYVDGAFTDSMTLEETIEVSAGHMAEGTDMSEERAREMLATILPNLKRWRSE